jgi:hypothetical protein
MVQVINLVLPILQEVIVLLIQADRDLPSKHRDQQPSKHRDQHSKLELVIQTHKDKLSPLEIIAHKGQHNQPVIIQARGLPSLVVIVLQIHLYLTILPVIILLQIHLKL